MFDDARISRADAAIQGIAVGVQFQDGDGMYRRGQHAARPEEGQAG